MQSDSGPFSRLLVICYCSFWQLFVVVYVYAHFIPPFNGSFLLSNKKNNRNNQCTHTACSVDCVCVFRGKDIIARACCLANPRREEMKYGIVLAGLYNCLIDVIDLYCQLHSRLVHVSIALYCTRSTLPSIEFPCDQQLQLQCSTPYGQLVFAMVS